ncbi:hypothetical protein H4R35_001762 [Dimargaris xerosporica]|nr:hypothetical protein H4R35_001762 [Dimargaris xerosporica]
MPLSVHKSRQTPSTRSALTNKKGKALKGRRLPAGAGKRYTGILPPPRAQKSIPIDRSLLAGVSDSGSDFDLESATGLYPGQLPTSRQSAMRDQPQCLCQRGYNGSEFIVHCDKCKVWFHGACVSITPQDAAIATHIYCQDCSRRVQRAKGTKIMKPPKPTRLKPKATKAKPKRPKSKPTPSPKKVSQPMVKVPHTTTNNLLAQYAGGADDTSDELDICPICDAECTCGAAADATIDSQPGSSSPDATRVLSMPRAQKSLKATIPLPNSSELSDVDLSNWESDHSMGILKLSSSPMSTHHSDTERSQSVDEAFPLAKEQLGDSDIEAEEEQVLRDYFAQKEQGHLSDASSSTFGYDYSPSNSDDEMYDELQFTPPVAAASDNAAVAQPAVQNWSSSSLDQWGYDDLLGYRTWSSNYDSLSGSDAGTNSPAASPLPTTVDIPLPPESRLGHHAAGWDVSSPEPGYKSDYASDDAGYSSDDERIGEQDGADESLFSDEAPFIFTPEPPTLLSTVAALSTASHTPPLAPTPAPTPNPALPSAMLHTPLSPSDLTYIDALIDQDMVNGAGPALGPSALPQSLATKLLATRKRKTSVALDSLALDIPGVFPKLRKTSPQATTMAAGAYGPNDLLVLAPEPTMLSGPMNLTHSDQWPTPAEAHGTTVPQLTNKPALTGSHAIDQMPLPSINATSTISDDGSSGEVNSLLHTSVLLYRKRNRQHRTKRKWGDGAPSLLYPSRGRRWLLTRPRNMACRRGPIPSAASAHVASISNPVRRIADFDVPRFPLLDGGSHSDSATPIAASPEFDRKQLSSNGFPSDVALAIEELLDTEQLTQSDHHSAMDTELPMTETATTGGTLPPYRWDRIPISSFRVSRALMRIQGRQKPQDAFTYADALKRGSRWRRRIIKAPSTTSGMRIGALSRESAPRTFRQRKLLGSPGLTSAIPAGPPGTPVPSSPELSVSSHAANRRKKRRGTPRPVARLPLSSLKLHPRPTDANHRRSTSFSVAPVDTPTERTPGRDATPTTMMLGRSKLASDVFASSHGSPHESTIVDSVGLSADDDGEANDLLDLDPFFYPTSMPVYDRLGDSLAEWPQEVDAKDILPELDADLRTTDRLRISPAQMLPISAVIANGAEALPAVTESDPVKQVAMVDAVMLGKAADSDNEADDDDDIDIMD